MTTIETPAPATPRLLVLTADAFGAEVARRPLGTAAVTVLDVSAGTHASLWPYADVIVVAAAQEQPRLCEAVDATAFVRGIPWLGLFVRGTDLQTGPVVVPGRTACYGCFVKRRDQHTPPGTAAAGTTGTTAAPSGYPRHHVGIAAGMVRAAVHEAVHPAGITGLGATVSIVNQLTMSLSRLPVVAVDDCARCGTRFDSRPHRSPGLWATLDAAARTLPAPPSPAGLTEAGV